MDRGLVLSPVVKRTTSDVINRLFSQWFIIANKRKRQCHLPVVVLGLKNCIVELRKLVERDTGSARYVLLWSSSSLLNDSKRRMSSAILQWKETSGPSGDPYTMVVYLGSDAVVIHAGSEKN